MYSVDIYKCINGQYKTNELVATIEFDDPYNTPQELIKFCSDNNVYADDCLLRCNNTSEIRFIIK